MLFMLLSMFFPPPAGKSFRGGKNVSWKEVFLKHLHSSLCKLQNNVQNKWNIITFCWHMHQQECVCVHSDRTNRTTAGRRTTLECWITAFIPLGGRIQSQQNYMLIFFFFLRSISDIGSGNYVSFEPIMPV